MTLVDKEPQDHKDLPALADLLGQLEQEGLRELRELVANRDLPEQMVFQVRSATEGSLALQVQLVQLVPREKQVHKV